MDKIETKEGKLAHRVTDDFDYDLMHGIVLKTVCPDCSKLSHYKMFDNELLVPENEYISHKAMEEIDEE